MKESYGKSVLSNFIWKFAERCGAQLVSFVVSIILARLLAPDTYGIIALVTVITGILQVFVDSGLGSSLIQKKDADDLDFSSVFFFNIVFCSILYIALYLLAPTIEGLYKVDGITQVIRALGLIVIISGLKNVQHAYVAKHMLFRLFFFSTLAGTVVAAVVGIYMAYKGYGVWALVAQYLTNNAIDMIFLWFTTKWRPKLMFSLSRLKTLISFGWKMLASALLSSISSNINQLIIGMKYSTTDLSYVNKGKQLPSLIVDNINTSINSVLFPAMSKEQSDVAIVREMTRKSIRMSTYIMMPMFMCLAVCAEPLISLLLTDKWLPCVPYLRIYCFNLAFMPVHTANLNAIKAMGRSDIFLKLDIVKKILYWTLLFVAAQFSVMAIASVTLITGVTSQIINSFPNKKLLSYGYKEQLKDMLPQIIISAVMGLLVYSISFLKLSNIATLIIKIAVGVLSYIMLSVVCKVDSYIYLKKTIINILQSKRIIKGD